MVQADSLDPLLRPRSIAVIGASRQPKSLGWQLVDNLLRHGFTGPVFPVNAKASAVHSIPAYPNVKAIPHSVDLALVVVPKEHVLGAVQEAVDAGVKGVLVISSGFREIGGAGVDREQELRKIVGLANVRMIGPNCVGLVNTDPAIQMNATFAPGAPAVGSVAFLTQSGAMGINVLDSAGCQGVGLSTFVSVGNKADVNELDLLAYFKNDPNTNVVLMYLESLDSPQEFIRICRELSPQKPICAVKSGCSGAGARAAASHTAAMAGSDHVMDGILCQAGVIRAGTVEELFDLGLALGSQPLPAGNRVAILTNSGGPGIVTADAAEAHGLVVGKLSNATEASLKAFLPEEASARNPVDMIASANAKSFHFGLTAVLQDPTVDAVITVFVSPLGVFPRDIARSIIAVRKELPQKPILTVWMGKNSLFGELQHLFDEKIPAFSYPESAARALGGMWRRQQCLRRPTGRFVEFLTQDETVRQVLAVAVRENRKELLLPEALNVLQAYQIPVAKWQMIPAENNVVPVKQVVEAAEEIGFPLVLKIVSSAVSHKTDCGGVALNLDSASAVEKAVCEMQKAMVQQSKPIDGMLVQEMVGGGLETIVGHTRVENVGPMLMFGMGGIHVEILNDVVWRLAPLLDVDAQEMIQKIKLSKILDGVRGKPASDKKTLVEIILKVSQLVVRFPEIAELDINPLTSFSSGAKAVDARIHLV